MKDKKINARQGDVALGFLSIIIGAVILVLTKVQGLELVKSSKMGPGFFPVVCGIGIIACGILLLLEVSSRARKAKKEGVEDADLDKNIVEVKELGNLGLFVLLGVLVLLLTKYLGLLTCLGLSVIAYLKIQGKESWVKSIIIGLCMMVFLYGVFVLFLHVPVPKGPLGF